MRRPWHVIALGLFLVFVGIMIMGNDDFPKILGEFIKEIGIATIISGGLIFSLETDHYRKYFSEISKKQSTDLLIDDSYIKNLNDEKRESLKNKLDKELFFKNRISDDDKLWDFHNQEIAQLLNDYYYSQYNLLINCRIEKLDNNVMVIKKNLNRKIIFENPTKNEHLITVPLDSYFEEIEGINNSNLLKVNKCVYRLEQPSCVLNKNITESVKNKITFDEEDNSEFNSYFVAVKCNEEIELPPNSKLTLEYETETIVPLTDKQYVHRLSKPCKNYRTTFVLLDSKNYSLDGWGFAFNDKNKLNLIRNPYLIEITFDDWVLPGDGCVIILREESHINK